MNSLTKKTILFTIIFWVIIFSFSNSFALDYSQKTTINNDKTGTIRIQYSANNSEIKGAEVYMSLPFKEDKIKAAFSSDNNKVQSVTVNPNKDGKTNVSVVITFKYIGKLNTSSFFSNVKITYFVSGDSTTFIYELPKNEQIPSDFIPVYVFELPSKEIIKSSGTIKGNSVQYGLVSEKVKNGIKMFATFLNSNEQVASDNKTDGKKSSDDKEEGSCGLFGIELPIILGIGYAFSRKFRKEN